MNEGTYIKDCSFLLSEDMIEECSGNLQLIESNLLLEGAKLDFKLKNFLKEGKDYRGLKKDLKTIIKANEMSDEDLQTGKQGFMHIAKRILQISYDILAIFIAGAAIPESICILISFGGVSFIGAIIEFVILFIINRLIRTCVDAVEFRAIEKDTQSIVKDLRVKAKEVNDEKMAKKLNSEADKLEASIKKYGKNSAIKL